MPRMPEQNQAIKDKRRQKLMDSALKVFSRKGYDYVTIDDVTKIAKCSHGLFYHYFPSMADCLQAVYSEIIRGSNTDVNIDAAEKLHGAQGLKVVCKNIESLQSLSGKDLTILLAIVALSESRDIDRDCPDFRERYDLHPTFARLLKEGQAEGIVISGTIPDILKAMFILIRGSLIRKNIYGVEERPLTAKILYSLLTKTA